MPSLLDRLPAMPKLNNLNWRMALLDPFPFLGAWLIGAVLAILVPLRRWNKLRQQYYNYIGYANEYEQQQRAYEQAQNNNNNNNNQYYVPNCSWWQWNCRQKQYYYNYQNQNQGGNDNQVQVPQWFIFIGGKTEEDRREREEMGEFDQTNSALRFIQAWTMIMFLGMVAYGVYAIYMRHNLQTLRFGFFLFAQFALLSLLMLGQGVISTEGREMEDSVYGWYGQTSVLMVYSDFWYALYSLIACLALTARMFFVRSAASESKPVASAYTEPKVTVNEGAAYQEMA